MELKQLAISIGVERMWKVFPVRVFFKHGKWEKLPLVKWATQSSCMEEDIEDMPWEQATNVGIVTGGLHGPWVIDEDVPGSAQQLGVNLETLTQTTVSGGKHFLYLNDNTFEQRNTQKYPNPGVDIRADGGLIVWYQDTPPSGTLAPWPYAQQLNEPKKEAANNSIPEIANVVDTEQGQRNKTIYNLASAALEAQPGLPFDLLLGYLLNHNQKHCIPALKESEVKTSAISAYSAYSTDPIEIKDPLEELRAALKPLSPQDLIDRPVPGWIIKDVLPKRGITMLYGQSGVGKSFAALDMAISLALGRKWQGQSVQKTKTVYLVLEGGGYFKQRLEAAYKKYGISSVDLAGMIRFYEPPIYDITTNKDRARDFAQILVEDGYQGCQVIVDTYAASQGGLDENSNSQAQQAINTLKIIADGVQGGVMMVHHEGLVAGRPRGATALTAAMDACIRMATYKEKERVVKISMFKLKDGDKTKFKALCQLSSTPLGYLDSDMQEVTSLVLDTYEDRKPSKEVRKLTEHQQEALGQAKVLISENGVKETPAAPPYLLLNSLVEQLNPEEKNFNTKKKILALVKYKHLHEIIIGEERRIFLENPALLYSCP